MPTTPARADERTAEVLPKTVAQLWRQGWVAEDENEAVRQAERMFDLFAGSPVRVDRLTFLHDGDYAEKMFAEPWPRVVATYLSVEAGWDGDVLYPEWYVRPTNLRQVVTTHEGRRFRMADIWRENEGQLTTTAPGIGTAEGFSHKDHLIYPTPLSHEVRRLRTR